MLLNLLKFLLGLGVLVFIPGWVLTRLLKLRGGPLATTTLSLALGLVTSVVFDKWARLAGFEPLFFLWLGGCVLAAVVLVVRRPPSARTGRFRLTKEAAVLAVLMAAVLAVLAVDSFRNGRPQPDGAVRINLHYHDGFLRLATIREVERAVPPQMPFAAGRSLGYHYGYDLFVGLFSRFLGLDVLDLVYRFTIALFFALFLFAGYLFVRELTGSVAAAGLGAGLLLFGSGGLGYLAAVWLRAPLGGNVFRSLYFFDLLAINSILPAFGLFFAGAYGLLKAVQTRAWGWSLATAVLWAGLAEFKVFLAGPVPVALVLAAVLYRLRYRDPVLVRPALLTTGLTAVALVPAFLGRSGAPAFTFRIEAADWVLEFLKEVRIESWTAAWQSVVHEGRLSFQGLILSALILAVFLLGAFGLSILVVPAQVRTLFAFRKEDGVRLFLAVLVLLAIGAFFGLGLYLEGVPRHILNIYNFYVALAVLIALFAERVARAVASKRPALRAAAVGLAVVLSVPNSLWFLALKTSSPEPRLFGPTFLETAAWIRTRAAPEAVVVQPLDLRYGSYFSGRPAVLDDAVHSYLGFHIGRREIARRRADINRFFADPSHGADVLDRYGVSLVWSRVDDPVLGRVTAEDPLPCLGPAGDTTSGTGQVFWLRAVFRNADFVVLEVVRAAASERPGSGP